MSISPILIGILAAALTGFVIGFLWHGPLFGKLWMQLSNFTPEQMELAKQKSMAMPMFIALVAQIVTAFALFILTSVMRVATLWDMFAFTSLTWFAFIAMPQLNAVLWEHRSFKLYLFNVVYYFVLIFAMTAIITLLR